MSQRSPSSPISPRKDLSMKKRLNENEKEYLEEYTESVGNFFNHAKSIQ